MKNEYRTRGIIHQETSPTIPNLKYQTLLKDNYWMRLKEEDPSTFSEQVQIVQEKYNQALQNSSVSFTKAELV